MPDEQPGTRTRLYLWAAGENSKYGHIALETYTPEGVRTMYASFWPARDVRDIADAVQNVPARLVENYIDDIESMDNHPASTIIDIADLNIDAIRNAYHTIRTDIQQIPYSFVHSISLSGLNCASFVNRLLRAGGANIPDLSPTSFEKQFIFYFFWGAFLTRLEYFNVEGNTLIGRPLSSYELITSNAVQYSFNRGIEASFAFRWFAHIMGKYFDRSRGVSFSLFLSMMSMGIALFESGLLRSNTNSDFRSQATIILAASISIPLFYAGHYFLYERTLSPLNIYQMICQNMPGKITHSPEHSTLNDNNSFKPSPHRIFLLITGITYTIIRLKYIYDLPRDYSYKQIKQYAINFLGLSLITQYVHLNTDASYISLLMSLPVINKITEPDFGDSGGLMGNMDAAAEYFLKNRMSLYTILIILFTKSLYQKARKHLQTTSDHD